MRSNILCLLAVKHATSIHVNAVLLILIKNCINFASYTILVSSPWYIKQIQKGKPSSRVTLPLKRSVHKSER